MKMPDFHREEDQNYPMTQITLSRAHEKSALEMEKNEIESKPSYFALKAGRFP
ncbi:MAG: hypothetical protein LC437_07525 [Thiohalomonas sp.]|nr:hypothetical protein [Thiohalomonas sp.]